MKIPSILPDARQAGLRAACAAAWILAVLAAAQSVPEQPAPAPSLEKALTDPEVWKSGQLPGAWRPVSEAADSKTVELKQKEPVFGCIPQQLQAYYKAGALSEIQIVYLEAGNFYASAEVRALSSKDARKAFDKTFSELENGIEKTLSGLFGPGRRITVGKSQALRSRATEYEAAGLKVRLFAEDDQLVALSLQPAAAPNTAPNRGAARDTPQARRKSIESNVEKLPNGDVVVQNIPMVEQGNRGYCAIGTLTMLVRYYGLAANVDLIAAKAGYREGDVGNATLQPIYAACARESGLRLQTDDRFDFRKAKRLLLRGQPIIVARKLDRMRDDFHTEFAQRLAADPTARLPNPDRNERKKWPNSYSSSHASIITGFNEQRDEVLFTESWGEASRNRRMRIEEMEATAYQAYYFNL